MTVTVKDRVAVVTGGGRGLGRAYALALANAGAKVVVNDYGGDIEGNAGKDNPAQEVVDEINAAGGQAVAHHGDVTRDATTIVGLAISTYGRIDIIVNNAGVVGKIYPHDNVNPVNFMRVVEITALGTAMMTSAAYPYMQKQITAELSTFARAQLLA